VTGTTNAQGVAHDKPFDHASLRTRLDHNDTTGDR
jgi:hypothetical protein